MRKAKLIRIAAGLAVGAAAGSAGYVLGFRAGASGFRGMEGAEGAVRRVPSLLENGSGGAAQRRADPGPEGGPRKGESLERSGAAAPYADVGRWLAEIGRLLQGGMMNQRNMVKGFQMMQSLREEDVPEALRLASETSNRQQKYFLLSGILGRMAEFDAPGAIAQLKALEKDDPQVASMGAMHGIMSAWVEKDAEAAWRWFQEAADAPGSGASAASPFESSYGMAAMPLFHSLAAQDLDSAFERMNALGSQQARAMALQGILSSAVSGEGREGVLQRVGGIEDAAQRQSAYQQLLTGWAHENPAEAIDWFERNSGTLGEDPNGHLRRQLAAGWMQQDPQKAADWWWEGTPEGQRAEALPQIVSSWGYRDPDGASQWLETFEPGPELDQAVTALVQSSSHRAPQQALEWAQGIQSEEMRANAVEMAVRNWVGIDRAAALDYLRGSPALPAERVETLLQGLDPGSAPQ